MADIGNQQRDAVKQYSPPWLANGFGERFLYNLGLGMDALLEKMNQAMRARMPTLCDASALPLIGSDRLIAQGPNEPTANYRVRLQKAFDSWQQSGTRRSVLQQVLAYVSNPANVPGSYMPSAAIVSVAKTVAGVGSEASWDTYYYGDDTSKPPSHRRVVPCNWNWDNVSNWWNSFLILYFPIILSSTTGTTATFVASGTGGHTLVTGLTGMTAASVGQFLQVTGAASSANNGIFQVTQYVSSTQVWIANSAAVLPDANNGSIHWTLGSFPAIAPQLAWDSPGLTWASDNSTSQAWDVNVSPQYVQALQGLLRTWKSANTFYPWIIMSFVNGTTGSELSVNQATGADNPDGKWGSWAKTVNNVAVPSRTVGLQTSPLDAYCDGSAVYVKNYQLPLAG